VVGLTASFDSAAWAGLLAWSDEAAHALPEVPAYQTWTFAAILLVTLILLATEKIHKTVLALLSGLVCLLLADAWGYFPKHPEGGHHLPVYIPMVEWEVIGIVIFATVFVETAARSGVFTWISVKILKLSRGDPFRLLILFSILTAVFSAFLDNITAMIIIGSLTWVACNKLSLDPKPYLITEGIMTNVGGLLTLISSIPNIIIGKTAGISYLTFLIVSVPYVAVATAASMFLARLLFGSAVAPLAHAETRARNLMLVNAFDEWETVEDKRFFYTSFVGVILVILGFALKDQVPILRDFGIELVAAIAAVFMLLLKAREIEKALNHVPWPLVFFFVGLFTIIGVMEHAAVLDRIGRLLEAVTRSAAWLGNVALMWLTAIFSSITDNIPLAAMLAKIFGPTSEAAQSVPASRWWAIVFGANLGGNVTPIGSASTVVAVTIMKKHNLKISFLSFVKLGGTFALVQLILASAYVLMLQQLL
jgi:Na+/H+ antiporter NhaD/arsenite permease-like protein